MAASSDDPEVTALDRLTMSEWLKTVVKIETSNEEFYRLFRQALEDMAALRLPIKDTDHMVFLPAAGLPWFVAPFGRDSLIVSLQNILIYPKFARGALAVQTRTVVPIALRGIKRAIIAVRMQGAPRWTLRNDAE